MEGREEWRVLRCAGVAHGKAIIDPIMLRFRPIAPKPVAGGSISGVSSVDKKNMIISRGKTKRKYARVRKNNTIGNSRRKKTIIREQNSANQEPVTLQLLPEKRNRTEYSTGRGTSSDIDRTVGVDQVSQNQDPPRYLNIETTGNNSMADKNASDLTDEVQKKRVVESWVTVECVTDACMEYRELGFTDKEKMNNLEADACPGFVSDSSNRVQWVNGAFKRMVRQRNGGQSGQYSQSPEITVRFVVKAKLPNMASAFTCQVKVQYTWGKEKRSKIVPCDVWRMDGGGFAWKLDVKAALTLGPCLQD